jgi:hypothetical protein
MDVNFAGIKIKTSGNFCHAVCSQRRFTKGKEWYCYPFDTFLNINFQKMAVRCDKCFVFENIATKFGELEAEINGMRNVEKHIEMQK